MTGRKKKNRLQNTKRHEKYLNPQRVCEDIVELYLLTIFGVFPLIIGTGSYGYSNLVKTKAYFWLWVSAIWVCCLGGYWIWCKKKKFSVSVQFCWIHAIGCAFLIINILSALLSKSVEESFWMVRSSNTNSVLFIASYIAAFMGVSLFGQLKTIHIWALGVSTLLSDILSVSQLAGLNLFGMYPKGLNYYNKYKEYTGAYLGTLGNVDVLSAFLCFSIPVLTVFALRSEKKRDRFLLVPALLSVYVLIKSDTDAGKVGLLGCFVIALPIVIRNSRRQVFAGIVCTAALIFGGLAVYCMPAQSGLMYEVQSVLHGHIEPSFGHDRVKIWQEAGKVVLQRPVLGNGPGSGAWLLDIRTVNEKWNRTVSVRNVHNTYLGYLMDTGILGLGLYLTLLGAGYVSWIRNRKDDLAAALGAGLAGYLIQDFFCLNVVTVAPFLWIGLALLTKER